MAYEIGMDSDQVRAFAARMDAQAASISGVISVVNSLVGQLQHAWGGNDATDFVGWWTNKHRPELQGVLDSIAGLATSARNNANAQDAVSGGSGAVSPGHIGNDRTTTYGAEFDGRSLDVSRETSSGPTVRVDAHGASHLGVVPVSGDVQGQAYATVTEGGHVKLSKDSAEAGVMASLGVGAGIAASGTVGNKYVSADGRADAGVEADVTGQASAGISKNGVDVKGGLDAQATAHADVAASGQVGGVGVGGGLHGYVGAGLHAQGEAEIGLQETKFSLSIGASLGLGVGVDVSIDVKPQQVLDEIMKVW